MPSLLDRLTDPESVGTARRTGYSLEQIEERVRRDLSDLLNSRRTHMELPEAFTEVHESILTYGLPDFTSSSAVTPEQQQQLATALEEAIRRFEPRLRDVRATLIEIHSDVLAAVQFRIEARLNLDPAPEVSFNTILDLTSGNFSVERAPYE